MNEIPDDIDLLIEDLEKAYTIITTIVERYPGDKNVIKLTTHIKDMLDGAKGDYNDEE